MTQELIWGKSGSPHIDGNDIGTINLAMRGVGNYVLDYKDNLKATVASANKVTIGTGVMSFEGRDIIISAAENVTIESGSQGVKRNDIICEHYHRDTSSGVETTNLVAIKGTPASSNPKDPTIPSGTILGGATDAYMPLWRVPLDGISVGTPVQLFEILTPLKTVGDSVTHRMVGAAFKRSDGQLAVNNGQTLMNVEITDKTIPGAYVTATGKGGEIRGLEPGNYLVFASLPLVAEAGWYSLSVDKTGNGNIIGTTVGEQLVNGNGYTRLNAVGFATITSETDGIWIRVDSNHDATMRTRGGIYIIRI